ncbi:electron transfer flavoprotein subunit alpha/FixB family protein [Glaciimonas immobilis]|uniref:Electron transfer flavoprotein alpha subunit n=1 Tax=Glaciimonas immobilis TaxID=728004 RepID=A0A840RPZ4_9BURK|nr:electron transfer flavoprotein subunit alpha/FixB family protein [Glaciimonas immobilis]KAF3999535.1 electron transfer flavoprotein subunit alpha/FixB family protein [Glaciimonas immobilis]MBB5199076.1 electron transfer flavoprotein alpha subunit [Glaciimonas immobilis]
MTKANGILVIVELKQGKPSGPTCELLGLAALLAKDTGGKVFAAVFGSAIDAATQTLIAHGADIVYLADHPTLSEYQADAWVQSVAKITLQAVPAIVLLNHTATGADLAPRLAFRLGTMVAMGAIELAVKDSAFHITRPCYGNNAREVLSINTEPAIATVKAKTQEALVADYGRVGEVISVPIDIDPATLRTRVVDRQREVSEGVSLESATIIVAGGRGLGGPDGFRELEKLASQLGGAVGASRVACDLGWCPPSWQIGLTGKTVAPDLYIAVGISGASHHLAGIGAAKTIVSINSDPDAAMFDEARYGIVGDHKEVLPALVAEIHKMKSTVTSGGQFTQGVG